MNTIYKKNDILYLNCKCENPAVEKQKIIIAIVAAIRWYAGGLVSDKSLSSDCDEIYTLTQILEDVIKCDITTQNSKAGEFILKLPGYADAERIEVLNKVLIAANRWYVISHEGDKYGKIDKENLLVLLKLQLSTISIFHSN